MKYQTDYDGFIADDGCLLCMITTICEDFAGKELTRAEFLILIETLYAFSRCSYDPTRPVISAENNFMKPGAFVWDHEAVGNEVFQMLGTHFRLKYVGKIYMAHYIETHPKAYSFGSAQGANRIILQGVTEHGNGHFFGTKHNPYQPASEIVDLKSIRYYKIGGTH